MYKKILQDLSDKLFEDTGVKLDVDLSMINLEIAFACETQRETSRMPEIPVFSLVELTDKFLIDDKLRAFDTDYFTVLDEHADTYMDMARSVKGTFKEKEADAHMHMLFAAYNMVDWKFVNRWAKTAKDDDRLLFRQQLTKNMEAKAYRSDGEDIMLDDTDEFMLIFMPVGEGDTRHADLYDHLPL